MGTPSSSNAAARGGILFIVTEDWFFASHFLGMARAALAAGHPVAVVCRCGAARARIEAQGIRVLPLQASRRETGPLALLGAVVALRALMRREQPALVHLVAWRSIVVGGLAARLAGRRRRIVALTGAGYVGIARGVRARLARLALRLFVRLAVDGPRAHFLFENASDPALFGLDPADAGKVTIVGGAGVDPAAFSPSPPPSVPPLRLALVARLLWSKGVDVAVAATQAARARGADVTLSLYGAPDPDNPAAIALDTLRAWSATPGIAWHGRTEDVAAVYADHHLCCLPSRGGEGLPRTLLEAAACARGILTTDVPGCRDFVRDGVEGRVVPPDDVAALTEAIVALAGDGDAVARFGAGARRRLDEGFTAQAVEARVLALYRAMLAA